MEFCCGHTLLHVQGDACKVVACVSTACDLQADWSVGLRPADGSFCASPCVRFTHAEPTGLEDVEPKRPKRFQGERGSGGRDV